jgi:DNA-directed RNA polymerase subunit RPC12/RpoP
MTHRVCERCGKEFDSAELKSLIPKPGVAKPILAGILFSTMGVAMLFTVLMIFILSLPSPSISGSIVSRELTFATIGVVSALIGFSILITNTKLPHFGRSCPSCGSRDTVDAATPLGKQLVEKWSKAEARP